jgi:hypothetical protein
MMSNLFDPTVGVQRLYWSKNSNLYRSCESSSRKEMPDIYISGGGTAPVRLVIRP